MVRYSHTNQTPPHRRVYRIYRNDCKENKSKHIQRKSKEFKGVKNMKNLFKKSLAFAAAFYFILTWIGFPIAALIMSQVRGMTFGAACATPYLIATFGLGSLAAAFSGYSKAKNASDKQ